MACQVVPDLATFAVDDGFSYVVPDGLTVSVGDRVRIRVSGKRRRGFVTAVFPAPAGRTLLPIDGKVGDVPSFGPEDLDLLRWCAAHYVAPLSTVLKKTVPPNVPKASTAANQASPDATVGPAASVTYHVEASPHDVDICSRLSQTLGDQASALVIAPSVAEVESLADSLRQPFGERVVVSHSLSGGAPQTRAWDAAVSTPGTVLVGTREVVLWPVAALSAVVIVEDARRVMRSPATPTFGVREIALRRAGSAGVPVDVWGPLPSLELIHSGATIEEPDGRWWPLVEVIDRRTEPPSGAALLEATRSAIVGVAGRGGRVFVLVPRRGDAAAFLCMRCGSLRRCPSCSSGASGDSDCARCGASLQPCEECGFGRFRPVGAGIGGVRNDLARLLGDDVGVSGEGRTVTVGTERDLIGVEDVDLAVAVGFDGSSLAPNYLAAETTLRLLARLANTVRRGRGNRALIQTSDPTQPVIAALRSGRGAAFLVGELELRQKAGFPPIGQLLALEIEGATKADSLDKDLRASVGDDATVLGPAPVGERQRWLVQARNLDAAKISLRTFVRKVRDTGGRVRVDVDPIDL